MTSGGPELTILVLVVALIWSGTAMLLAEQRLEARESALRQAGRLAASFAESVARRVDVVDGTLLTLRESRAAGRHADLSAWTQGILSGSAGFQFSFIGADGIFLGSNLQPATDRLDLSDRAHFRVHADHPERDILFVSRPIIGRVSGLPSLQFSRRMTDAGGRFAGVVVASVDPRFLTSLHAELGNAQGHVVLIGDDGVVRAKAPPRDGVELGDAIAAAIPPEGGDFTTGAEDWPNLMGNARRIADRPLHVAVALTGEEAYAAYRALRTVLLGAAAVATLLSVVATFLLARRRQKLASSDRDLTASREAMAEAVENISHGIAVFGPDDRLQVANRRAAEAMGVPPELLGTNPSLEEITRYQFEHGEFGAVGTGFATTAAFMNFARAGWASTDRDHVYERTRPDGTVLEVRTRALPSGGAVRTYADVTDRRAAEEQARHFALYDPLTGLPSRTLLVERLGAAIPAGPCTVLFLGLDHFGAVNDRYGHDAGDRLLAEMASRLRAVLPRESLLARHAGDEFAVLLAGLALEEAAATARAVLEAARRPFEVAGREVTLGVSIGIAASPEHGCSAAELLRGADTAMRRAKGNGRCTFAVFDPAADLAEEDAALKEDLRAAVGAGDFYLTFQPVCDARTLRPSGFEALIRWRHPTRGEISPATFIPLAEQAGLILPIGAWVLRAACEEATRWPAPTRASVNMSPPQFLQPDLVEQVASVLAETGLPPGRLDIEITEGLMLRGEAVVMRNMEALREMGVRISLDDFGTGHSGLSYLRRFPFDRIKIDQSFVRNLGMDAPSRAIVATVLSLARSLRLEVVAEGVENEAQLAELRDLRCGYVQGYLAGRPMPASEARALFEAEAAEVDRRIAA